MNIIRLRISVISIFVTVFMLISRFVSAQISNTSGENIKAPVNYKKILLFDKLNGESFNLANNQYGVVSPDTKFVRTGYGEHEQGFLSGKGPGNRCITYNSMGNFNPLHGTLEMWVKLDADFSKGKQNEDLALLKIDDNNCMGIYYNREKNSLVYWIKDADTPGQNIHQKDLNTFIIGPVLDWKSGECHHIAITWEKNHTLMYIDGASVRWQSYRGQLYAEFNKNSKIKIARDSNFIIDTIRIWNYARAPRKLDQEPSLHDMHEDFKYKVNPVADDFKQTDAIITRNYKLSVTPETGLPSMLVDAHKNIKLVWGISHLFFNGKQVKINGQVKSENNQISGIFNLLNEPAISMRTRYSSDKNSIKIEITLRNKSSMPWQKDVALALNCLTKDSMGFMAASGAPFNMIDGITAYCGTKQGNQVVGQKHPSVYLPTATVYQPKQDDGFTITQPMDVPEYVTIDFGHDFPVDQLAMINRKVTIAPGASRTLTYYIKVHSGCWRAGLKFIRNKFPKTFTPIKKDYSKIDGGMVIGTRSDPSFLEDTKGTLWREISVENRDQVRFGNWVPDKPNANTLQLYDKLYKQIEGLHKANILGLLYMQARECTNMDMAKDRFSDSLIYNSKGNIVQSYGFGAKMTCKEGSLWFNHLISQSQKIFKQIPNADGTFFDNAWDKEYAKVINAIAKQVHKQPLYFVANGASANCAAALDSIMIEGDRDSLRGLAYFGLAKPMTYVPINNYNGYGFKGPAVGLIDNFQADLKECLLYGVYYGFNWSGTKGFSEESKKIYKAYLPLQNNLRGKKWYLVPHALTVPENVRANIFENGKGELIIYITSAGYPFRDKAMKPFKVSIRAPKRTIESATIRRIEDSQESNIPFKQNGERINIIVTNHCSITMLKFK